MKNPTTSIVLIEDDEDDYILTRDLLNEIGRDNFQLAWFASYDDALTNLPTTRADIYLVDYRLGQHNGLELLAEALFQGVHAPIILLTGQGNREIDLQAMQAGAADYLVKGEITSFLLERAIRYAIERRQAEQQLKRRFTQLQTIYQMTASVNRAQHIDDIYKEALDGLCQALGADQAAILLLDDQGVLRHQAWQQLSPAFRQAAESHDPWMQRDSEPLLVEDIATDLTLTPLQATLTAEGIRALAFVPLIYQHKFVGKLLLCYAAPDSFNDEDIDLAKAMANTIVFALERKRAETEIQQQAARAQALARVAARLNAQLDLDKVLNTICEETAQALQVPIVMVSLYDPYRNALVLTANLGLTPNLVEQIQPLPREAYARLESEQGAVIVLPDLQAQPEVPNRDLYLQDNLRTIVGARMMRSQQLLGSLNVGATGEARRFTADELALLQGLADQVAQAISNARLFDEAERRLRQTQALHDIDSAITTSLDLRLTLTLVLKHVLNQLGVDAADILLHRPGTRTLEYVVGAGFYATPTTQAYRLDEGSAGRAALDKRLIYIPDLTQEVVEKIQGNISAREGFRSYVVVPLLAKGQVKGVLEVFHRSTFTANQEWFEFLEALGGQAAIAIDNFGLFDDLQRSNANLALAYDTTLEGWSRALDLRDKETEGHSRRVTEMTLTLAQALGINDAELIHIRRGALLHDIGKMGIPDSILLKPGKLTEDEWQIMRKHPGYAYDLLSPILFLQPARDIPYCHHEKWDGTGYPRGLKGEQIPLAARLFAIADVWDALRSDRPYRSGWPEEKVRDHILALSGTHFDPQVIEVFKRITQPQ